MHTYTHKRETAFSQKIERNRVHPEGRTECNDQAQGLKRQAYWPTTYLYYPSISLPLHVSMFLFLWYALIPHSLHPRPCPDKQLVPNYFFPKGPLWLHQYPNLIFLTLLPWPYMVLVIGYVGPVGLARLVPKRFPKLPFNYLWSSTISHIIPP